MTEKDFRIIGWLSPIIIFFVGMLMSTMIFYNVGVFFAYLLDLIVPIYYIHEITIFINSDGHIPKVYWYLRIYMWIFLIFTLILIQGLLF